MKTFTRSIIVAVIMLWVFAIRTWGLSLAEVVKESLKNNPEVLAARSRWEAAKARVPQAKWWGDPQFAISFEDIPQGSYSLKAAKMRMYSISQMIPFPRKLHLRGQMAQKDAEIAEEQYEAKQREIIAKAKSAFYRLFLVHKSIEIENEERNLLLKFEKTAQTKYFLGQVTQHDVLRAQVELSLLTDDLITLQEEDLPTAEAKLNAILNRPPHNPLGVPEEFTIPQIEKSREEIEQLALEHRQALKAAKCAAEMSKTAYNLAKMEYLPDFKIKLMREEMEMPMGTESSNGIMLSINIPLWFWKKGWGVSEKQVQKRSAEESYQAMRNKVLFEVQSALAKFRASERKVNLFQTTLIPLAEQALKAATISYETGKIDLLTLINSERTLRDVRLKYYKALTKHGENLANLERAVGTVLSP